MCIGREKELEILVELHSSDRFEDLVQYERRLVGKTSLLLVCSKGHAVIFYTTQTRNDSLIKLEMEFTYSVNSMDTKKVVTSERGELIFLTWYRVAPAFSPSGYL